MRISGDCFANFVADFHTTFVPVLHECHIEVFHVSRTGHEIFSTCLKILCEFFHQNIWQDCHATRGTFVGVSRTCRCKTLAPGLWQIYNFSKFTMQNFCDARMNVMQVWNEVCATVLRKKCEHLATVWRENKTKQHSFQCHATVIRMKMKISYICGKVRRHSHECLVTVVRQSRVIFSKLD